MDIIQKLFAVFMGMIALGFITFLGLVFGIGGLLFGIVFCSILSIFFAD